MEYIFFSCLSLIISYFLFSKIVDMRITKINFLSFAFYFIMVFEMAIGSLLIILMKDHHYIISKIGSLETRKLGYYCVNLFIISFPGIILICSKIFKFNIKEINENCNINKIKILFKKNTKEIYYICWLFFIIGILSMFYTIFSIKTFPLIHSIFYGDGAKLRIIINRNFPGNQYIKNLIFYIIPPLFTFITYIYWKVLNCKKWKILFINFFVLTFISKTFSLEKAPFFIFLINFYFLKILLFDKIEIKTLILGIFFITVSIIGIYVYIGNFQSLLKYNSGPIGRIILSQIAGFYASLEIFPKFHEYLGFDFSKTSSRLIMEILNPTGVKNDVAGVMNTLFLAEAYSHFAIKGIICSMLYVPFVFSIFFKIFSILKKSPEVVALYCYLGFSYFTNNLTGGIIAYIYSPYVAFNVIYVLILIGIVYIFKSLKK